MVRPSDQLLVRAVLWEQLTILSVDNFGGAGHAVQKEESSEAFSAAQSGGHPSPLHKLVR